MTRRPALRPAITLTAVAALSLTACGTDDNSAKESSASPTPSSSTTSDRPRIELPSDLSYTFEWSRTGDEDKDAVLADSEQSIKAVDLAIAHQNALDGAYLYYYEGEAAAATQEFIQAYVKAKARVTGAYRYYDASVDVSAKDNASLVYCEDQSKAYDMYLKPEKINKTSVTKNSYVLYTTQLRKNTKGVWVAEKLTSLRGSDKCQP
ncbi:hypothetical protein ACIQI8_20795 [Streptomyces sp. NPDC092369]|uniref:hypothetical protein n=1 Tax=Streptomyces sp. NPDC092369 TaxID=3366015 RepID=UPI003820AB3D